MTAFERLPKSVMYQEREYFLTAGVTMKDCLSVRYEDSDGIPICVWNVRPGSLPKFPDSEHDIGHAKTFNYCCLGVLETIKRYITEKPES